MSNLVKIDELVVEQHSSLLASDECYYLLEYTARQPSSYSRGNNLIRNLKKPMDRKGRPEWKYKGAAIRTIAQELQSALPAVIDFDCTTIIPIPPSKIKTSPLYDDRVLQILQKSCPDADIRELIVCKEDCNAAHESSDHRPSVQEILDNYEINTDLDPAIGEAVVVFDDMITAGNHYTACRTFIEERYPGKQVVGIFVARRVLHLTSLFDDFDIC
jgi:hypothetical protein